MNRRPPPKRPPHQNQPPQGRPAHHGAARQSAGHAHFLYGLHAVAEAWRNPARHPVSLLATEAGLAALGPAMAEAGAKRIKRPVPRIVDRTEIERALPPGAVHQGLALDPGQMPELGVEDLLVATHETASSLLLVLDQITDPHNVGAILRSAAAFGAAGVIVQTRHAPPITGTLAKVASGAVEHVPMAHATNLTRALEELKEAGFVCVGLAEQATATLAEVPLTGKVALVLGAEGDGIRRLVAETCDHLAKLPTQPPIASLNVSNAAAVALYEVARRRS
ncbi:23S rRNA (guanosine(2251)-2'-O)-methyltransferase RlmB [Roseiterribacter gracilis]|uniref:23S rRNA (Guanosine(2251)-2'-O)-methyltransferase RlmB n=1 Tax=Roseiterribacter gracilis TaxID=2812848 RepID=A0A8S8X9T6_9PROT|nr:23S rRNA (guanosine(2251)-2'-O)-methyltransferase RlmB [Rhodospirillales bacterium TMPK1]